MTGPDLVELRAQLRADVLEQLTKVGPRVDPGVLDKIATRIMVSIDSYAAATRVEKCTTCRGGGWADVDCPACHGTGWISR